MNTLVPIIGCQFLFYRSVDNQIFNYLKYAFRIKQTFFVWKEFFE